MSDRQFTILLWCGLGAIAIVGGFWVYWLQFQELAELDEQLTAVRTEREIAQKKKAAIPAFKEKVRKLKEDIAVIRQQIPVFNPKEEHDKFADGVDMLRKKCRVEISEFRLRPSGGSSASPVPKDIFRSRYEFKVQGGFYQLVNFLNHLETERRFMVAENIKLTAGTTGEGRNVMPVRELQLTLSTYLQRMPPPPPGAAVAATKPGEKPGEKPTEPSAEEARRLSTPIPD